MKTERYLEQLLYRHQCVQVPSFGAFLGEMKPARLDEVSNTFYPPTKAISFNPLLKSNDGLLATHISRIERISYDAALERIASDVNAWRETLIGEHRLELANIGTLSVNAEGNLIFESVNTVNYHTGSFGLSAFVSPVIRREVMEVVGEAAHDAEAPVQFVPETAGNSRQWLKYAAIFAIGLGTSGFFGNRYYQGRIAAETELVQHQVEKEVNDRIQQATFFIENPLPDVVMPVKETHKPYHIIAGAFREERNARRVVARLTAAGYHAAQLKQNRRGLYPVSYGSYASLAEAQQALDTIRAQFGQDAWLLVEKGK